MANNTARLALPYILPGQAQKELFHNEALQRLDLLVQAVVYDEPSDIPPKAPMVGQTYLVGKEPSGEWAEYPEHLASFTEAGWIYAAPFNGMSVVLPDGRTARFHNGAWSFGVVEASVMRINGRDVLGGTPRAVEPASGGTIIDAEARRVLEQVLAVLKDNGLTSR